jgi:DNA-binding response OmpR family regulator
MRNGSTTHNVARARHTCSQRDAALLGGPSDDVLDSGGLAIFIKQHRAVFAGRELRLPHTAFRILCALVSRASVVCTRDGWLGIVGGEDVVVDPRAVDVHMRWQRVRLVGEPDGGRMIQTVHGVGCRFVG